MSAEELTVRRLETADHGRWDDFVRGSADGTFYHLSGWKTLIEEQLRHDTHYLMCKRGDEIAAVLPMARVKSWLFGDALISTPFLVYGGPIATDEQALDRVVSAAKGLADELRVDYLELRNRAPLQGAWHTKDTYVTFRKQIDPDPETNLMSIPRKQRAMIRKGIKAGLKAETDPDTSRLYEAMLACKRNLGTPFFGQRWLKAIKRQFDEQAEITTVTDGDNVVCSVMSFRYGDEILPYYGGGGELARDLKGNDFMYWAVMEKACQEGVTIFDYGRSSVGSGAYRFKKHWGFEPEPLSYQLELVNSTSAPELNPANPRYDLAVRTWKKLPLPVAALIGPPIARRLG